MSKPIAGIKRAKDLLPTMDFASMLGVQHAAAWKILVAHRSDVGVHRIGRCYFIERWLAEKWAKARRDAAKAREALP